MAGAEQGAEPRLRLSQYVNFVFKRVSSCIEGDDVKVLRTVCKVYDIMHNDRRALSTPYPFEKSCSDCVCIDYSATRTVDKPTGSISVQAQIIGDVDFAVFAHLAFCCDCCLFDSCVDGCYRHPRVGLTLHQAH